MKAHYLLIALFALVASQNMQAVYLMFVNESDKNANVFFAISGCWQAYTNSVPAKGSITINVNQEVPICLLGYNFVTSSKDRWGLTKSGLQKYNIPTTGNSTIKIRIPDNSGEFGISVDSDKEMRIQAEKLPEMEQI